MVEQAHADEGFLHRHDTVGSAAGMLGTVAAELAYFVGDHAMPAMHWRRPSMRYARFGFLSAFRIGRRLHEFEQFLCSSF